MFVIHIGCGKVGTKSIQGTLHANRQPLAKQGIVWPKSANRSRCNFGGLASALDGDASESRLLDELADTLHANKSSTVVVSSEHLQRVPKSAILVLKNLADGTGHEIKIALYIRSYADWVRSKYLQRARVRAVVSRTKWKKRKSVTFDDYFPKAMKLASVRETVANWSGVFGSEAIYARHTTTLPLNDVVRDFLSLIGSNGISPTESRNVSPHWLEVELVRAMLRVEPRPGVLLATKPVLRRFLSGLSERISDMKIPAAEYLTREQRKALTTLYMEEASWLYSNFGTPLPDAPSMSDERHAERPFLPSLAAAPAPFLEFLQSEYLSNEARSSMPYISETLAMALSGLSEEEA